MDILESVKKEKERWEKTTLKKDLSEDVRYTSSGIPVKMMYTPDDLNMEQYLEKIGFPGEYPFTRGIQPDMYRGKLWTMRQYSGMGTAEETNARFRFLLEQGQTGLSVAFDLPTQMGYDSDHPLAMGEVGKTGVVVDSLADMEIIFKDLPLDRISTSMTINAPAAIFLAMYVVCAEKQGIPAEKLRGTIQNDILKEYTVRGTYIFPVKPSLRLITDIFAYCSKHLPKWNAINVASYHLREAGCDAVQEIAFSFANAIAYVEAGIEAGLNVDDFAPRISWIFNTHNYFFEEVAKFRAARRLWARIMRERFSATNEDSCKFRAHMQTGGSTLTAQQPLINIVRGTYQTLAAVLGGLQSMAVSSFDEAFCLPTEEAALVSLRTQQLLAYEAGVADVVDPLAGSFFVESLTDEIERRASDYLQKIDEMGGIIAAIEKGYIQQEIQDKAYEFQKNVESGAVKVVGVNCFKTDENIRIKMSEENPNLAGEQLARLTQVKSQRDAPRVAASLAMLKRTAEGDGKLMQPILEAVRAYTTLGEICGVLRGVFGEYKQTVIL